MTPVEIHELLDTRGLLEASQQSGTYALHVDVPDSVEDVARCFLDVSDVTPSDDVMERLANSTRVAYVGASGGVYGRLQDHAAGEVRQALFLRAFTLSGLVGVWPHESPFEAEYSRAQSLSREGWTVWCDGEVV